jgi:hypothetical protein
VITVRNGLASPPSGANWKGIAAVGLLAGTGFTVSVFVVEIALDQPVLNEAKVALLAPSIAAGALGPFALPHSSGQQTETPHLTDACEERNPASAIRALATARAAYRRLLGPSQS